MSRSHKFLRLIAGLYATSVYLNVEKDFWFSANVLGQVAKGSLSAPPLLDDISIYGRAPGAYGNRQDIAI